MEPWLCWVQFDCPLELSEGCVNLLALEIYFAEVGVRFHKARIYLCGSLKCRYSSIEVAGFSTRHSYDYIGFVVIRINGQCSFGSEDRITVMMQVEMEQADVVPPKFEIRF
ncbi:MAG: hypothetical protein QOD84_1929 [Acidobacteriaceae bacterium]|jgi:hypothetical protein